MVKAALAVDISTTTTRSIINRSVINDEINFTVEVVHIVFPS